MPVRKGFLTKQGGGIKTWHKRWFVLDSHKISYYKGQDVCSIVHERARAARTHARHRGRQKRGKEGGLHVPTDALVSGVACVRGRAHHRKRTRWG